MNEQGNSNETTQVEGKGGWFNWAKRHPGVILLGALVIAVLAYHKSPTTGNFERETNGQEVPLFI